MRYLKSTEESGLYYKKNEKFDLRAYTNANWAGNIDDRKSTSGGAHFLGKRLVTWTSKTQSCTSQSTAEAEYVVVAAINCTNILWIKKLLRGMKEQITEIVILYCDNISAINISKNYYSTKVNQIMYKSIVGKLQYVVHSRPDIALSIGIVSRFSTNPKENHLIL